MNLSSDKKDLGAHILKTRRRRELLGKFEKVYCRIHMRADCIGAWDDLRIKHEKEGVKSNFKEVWNSFSEERMIGSLHAFILLQPLIEKSIKNCTKIEKSIKFMSVHGYNTTGSATMR